MHRLHPWLKYGRRKSYAAEKSITRSSQAGILLPEAAGSELTLPVLFIQLFVDISVDTESVKYRRSIKRLSG